MPYNSPTVYPSCFLNSLLLSCLKKMIAFTKIWLTNSISRRCFGYSASRLGFTELSNTRHEAVRWRLWVLHGTSWVHNAYMNDGWEDRTAQFPGHWRMRRFISGHVGYFLCRPSHHLGYVCVCVGGGAGWVLVYCTIWFQSFWKFLKFPRKGCRRNTEI